MRSKSKILFFLLCLVSSVFVLASVSCGKGRQDVVDPVTEVKKINVTKIKIWKKDVLSKPNVVKDAVKVYPVAESQALLEIETDNCGKYDFVAILQGQEYTGNAIGGYGAVTIPDLPTESARLVISITASGYEDAYFNTDVNVVVEDVEGVQISFVEEGGKITEIRKDNQNVYSLKNSGTLKVSSSEADMQEVKINGVSVDLTNKKEATKAYSNIGSAQKIDVSIIYKYYKPVSRSFNLEYKTESDMPLELVRATILSGDNYKEKTDLPFESNEETVTMTLDKNIRYSLVKLEMEFNQNIKSCTVKCTDQRGSYNKFDDPNCFSGTFSGYVTHDIDAKGTEKALERVKGEKYTELLIVGYGTVTYNIEIENNYSKKIARTVKIENPFKTVLENGSIDNSRFYKISPFEGHTSAGAGYWINTKQLANMFILPFYFKGPLFKEDGNMNNDGFDDLAYMENVALNFEVQNENDFHFYYNVFGDSSASSGMEDKHEFKRVKGEVKTFGGKKYAVLDVKIPDLDDKYLDCFLSGKNTLPNPMYCKMYGKKFTKARNIKHGAVLGLENKQKTTWDGENFPSNEVFSRIFDYRLQMKAYEEQNESNGSSFSDNKYLKIGLKQKYTFFGSNKEESGWVPFLSGGTGDNRDFFVFKPLCKKSDIKNIKYTIKCGTDASSCSDVGEYKDIEAPLFSTEGDPDYVFTILGVKKGQDGKNTFFDFEKGEDKNEKIYKVDVVVTYNTTGGSGDETDKFYFMIDYKNEQTLERKSVGYDSGDSDLFGVPTHYAEMKKLDRAIMHSVADYSLVD